MKQSTFELLISAFDSITETATDCNESVASVDDLPNHFASKYNYSIERAQALFETTRFYYRNYRKYLEKSGYLFGKHIINRTFSLNLPVVISATNEVICSDNTIIDKVEFDNNEQKYLSFAILLCSRMFLQLYTDISHSNETLNIVRSSIKKIFIEVSHYPEFGKNVSGHQTYLDLIKLCDMEPASNVSTSTSSLFKAGNSCQAVFEPQKPQLMKI